MTRTILAATAAAMAMAATGAFSGEARAATAYDTAVESAPGLLGYYPFTPASQANDVANGHTGVLVDMASIGGPGTGFGSDPAQSSLVLPNSPASNSYATAGGANPLDGGVSTSGTILGWIKLADLPSTEGRVFSIAGESSFGNDLDLQIDGETNELRFYNGGGANASAASGFTTADLNQWIFVAGTFTSNSDGAVYINGVLAGSDVPGGHSDAGAPFYQGQSSVFGGRNFNGSLGGIAIYNTDLSAAQIQTIYDAALPVTVGGVPEPATWGLMLLGFGGLGAQLRRNRRRIVETAA